MESGEQCVIIAGLEEMLRLSAESLDFPAQVVNSVATAVIIH